MKRTYSISRQPARHISLTCWVVKVPWLSSWSHWRLRSTSFLRSASLSASTMRMSISIACSIVGTLTACWKLNLTSPLSGGSHCSLEAFRLARSAQVQRVGVVVGWERHVGAVLYDHSAIPRKMLQNSDLEGQIQPQ